MQGVIFDCVVLVVKRAGIPELPKHGTISKTALGGPPLSGHYKDSRLKHNSSLLVKMANLLSLELQPEGQSSGSRQLETKETLPGKITR